MAGARTAGSEGCVSVQVCCLKKPKIPPGWDNGEDLRAERCSVWSGRSLLHTSQCKTVLGVFSWEGMDSQDISIRLADLP